MVRKGRRKIEVKMNCKRLLELLVPLLGRLVGEPQVGRLIPLDREERFRTEDLHPLTFLSDLRTKIEVKKIFSIKTSKIFVLKLKNEYFRIFSR